MGATHPTPARGSKLNVSYGLINVAVKYAPFVRSERTSGKYLDPASLGPVTQQYVNEAGEVVKPVTGYAHGDGFVVLEPADVQSLESERDSRLELKAFAEPDLIDPLYIEKSFLVWPEKGQEAGYDLLCHVLTETGMVLVGTTVIRKSTKVLVLRYGQGCLIAHQCTYDANVTWYDHSLVTKAAGERPAPSAELLEMALQAFSTLPDEFDLSQVSDEYDERLRAAIQAAAEGRPVARAAEESPTPVVDLMEALKASVAAAGEPPKKRTRKKAAA
jgi:DNA end-binding protein Ku